MTQTSVDKYQCQDLQHSFDLQAVLLLVLYIYILEVNLICYWVKVIATHEFDCQTELKSMTVIEQTEFYAGEMMFTCDLQSTMCAQCTAIRVVDTNIRRKQAKRKTVHFVSIT